jgi:dienelactone hydrolase
MSTRNFSMKQYWMEKAKDWEPLLSFKGNTKEEWEEWHKAAYSKFIELLGEFPKKVELNATVEYSVEDGDIIRERVIFDTEDFMSVPCYVLRPKTMKADKSNPAIICSHGHGYYNNLGKEPVAGVRSDNDYIQEITTYNHNYGEQMARAGFLTISPDLRSFGERNDGTFDHTCNENFLKGAILGVYLLTLNIWDMQCCIDYLETRPEIDPGRIGMMGLSGGGTMTTFVSALDKRIKAADIMGYINSWKAFGIEKSNICGMQILPHIFKYFDTDEIAGLIAPRPLLIEMGIFDECFRYQDLIKGFEGVKKIYQAAGEEDRLWSDIKPVGHQFCGVKAFDFFKKYL